jgi:uncharacterized protein (DUF924 family)
MPALLPGPDAVLDYWFGTLGAADWYAVDAGIDAAIAARFGALHAAAAACCLYPWRHSADGALAEIIVLDQFSRNMFRGQPRAFACDALALALAQTAVAKGQDAELPLERRAFLYLPYMHSESLEIHAIAAQLFAAPGLEHNARFEREHVAILNRFGRYPHRNAALGRESTPAELAFLQEPGSRF